MARAPRAPDRWRRGRARRRARGAGDASWRCPPGAGAIRAAGAAIHREPAGSQYNASYGPPSDPRPRRRRAWLRDGARPGRARRRRHADPGRRVLDGPQRRPVRRGAAASRLRARLLARAPQGDQRGVRGVPRRGRRGLARGRPALRRGSCRRPHPAALYARAGHFHGHRIDARRSIKARRSIEARPAAARPASGAPLLRLRDGAHMDSRSGLRPPSRRGLMARRWGLLCMAPPAPADPSRVGESGPRREPRRSGGRAERDEAVVVRSAPRGERPAPRGVPLRDVGRSGRGGTGRAPMTAPIDNLIMNYPLTLPHFFERTRRIFPKKTLATRVPAVGLERMDYGRWAERTTRLAGALKALGVGKGDRVGTFAWNSHRHLEVYFAAPCMGAVLHTVNIRLSAADLTYIINHAGDKVLIVDASCWPTLEPIRKQLKTVEHVIVMKDTPGAQMPAGALDYEALLADARPVETWPALAETDAAGDCYTP